jgi:thioredoxin reductase
VTIDQYKMILNTTYNSSSAIMASPVDILIIGGGPAGLSAASSIVRQAHSTIIVDSGKYRNANSLMHTVPTWDHRQPSEFRAAAKKDLERYGTVKVEDGEVTSIKKTDEGLFEAVGSNGQVWIGRKLVLATGVTDVFPDVPGYGDCWISGMLVQPFSNLLLTH